MTAPTKLNRRGVPTTSIGRRNAACIGTNRGNGGTDIGKIAKYERQRDVIDPHPRHDKFYRQHWQRSIDLLVKVGDLSLTDAAICHAVAGFSNASGKTVYPAQQTIGDVVGRSASTVCRSLARAKQLGLMHWDHQFYYDDSSGKPVAKATSNRYEFLLPDTLRDAVAPRKPKKEQQEQPEVPQRTAAQVRADEIVNTARFLYRSLGEAHEAIDEELESEPDEIRADAHELLDQLGMPGEPPVHPPQLE